MNIQKNDFRQRLRCNSDKSFFQCFRKNCFVSLRFQLKLEELAKLSIVIHNKNPLLHPVFPSFPLVQRAHTHPVLSKPTQLDGPIIVQNESGLE